MSAGGFSVTALMASPMTENLFHRVIAHSGVVTFLTGLRSNFLDQAINIARQLGCMSEIPEEFVPCLRTVMVLESRV